MHCLSCKYDLSNLTEHRCPECGRAFDPQDPITFETRNVRKWRRLTKIGALIFLTCAALMVACFKLLVYPNGGESPLGLIWLLMLAVCAVSLLFTFIVALLAVPDKFLPRR